MISPSSFAVFALKFLQKSMMFTPCGPSAVPTGGAGVAFPAGIWIFTMAATRFFAISSLPSELRHLAEVELDGSLAAEDVDEHLELHLVLVDLGDLAREVGERPLAHAHRLARLVLEARPRLLRPFPALGLDLQDALDLLARERRRLGGGTHEAGDARG